MKAPDRRLERVRGRYENLHLFASTPGSIEFVAAVGKQVSEPFALVTEYELLAYAGVSDGKRDQWWQLVEGPEGEGKPLVTSGELEFPGLSFRRATPLPYLPLFVFSYPESFQAMHSRTTENHQLVLDFRGPQPSVLVALRCSTKEATGGNCSPYDVRHYQRTELACDWNVLAKDFACTQTDVLPLGWGERRTARRFLLRQEPLPSPDPAPRPRWQPRPHEPVTLPRGGVLGELALEGVGPLRAVFTGFLSRSTGAFTIYAGQGTSPLFEVRFFAVVLWPDHQVIVEITPRQLDIDGDLFESSLLRGQPVGPIPEVSVRALPSGEVGLHLLQAVANDQNVRGLYLLGLEETRLGLAVDGLLLATEAAYNSRCGVWVVPENAIAVEYARTPFSARLVLEPSFHVETAWDDLAAIRAGEASDLVSPFEAAACWEEGQGFRIERNQHMQADEVPPLFVVLSDDGELSTFQAAVTPRPGT